MPPTLWVPQVIRGNQLLRKRCEVSRELGLPHIHHDPAVLPHIIVIVMIILSVIQKLPAGSLIHVHIVDAIPSVYLRPNTHTSN